MSTKGWWNQQVRNTQNSAGDAPPLAIHHDVSGAQCMRCETGWPGGSSDALHVSRSISCKHSIFARMEPIQIYSDGHRCTRLWRDCWHLTVRKKSSLAHTFISYQTSETLQVGTHILQYLYLIYIYTSITKARITHLSFLFLYQSFAWCIRGKGGRWA